MWMQMVGHTRILAVLLLIQMIALLMYNFAGMCVTGELGAVFRTVLETMRTLFVWLVRDNILLLNCKAADSCIT